MSYIICFCLTGISWSGISVPEIFLDRTVDFHSTKQTNKDYIISVTEGISLPLKWARGGHMGGLVEGVTVVAGGNNWSNDKTTKYWFKNSALFVDNKWVSGPDLPKPLSYAMYSHDESGLYVAGGTSDGISLSSDVYYLNSLEEGEDWKSLPQLPIEISYGSGAILNGKFYVACGSIHTGNTNRMWVLDLNNYGNSWRECQSLPGVERMFPSLVACGKYLYLLGGLADFSPLKPLGDIYRYDPDDNKWTKLGDLPLKGYAWVSQSIDDNSLIITGKADGNIHKGIWIINLRDISMKHIGDLISPSTTAPLINIEDKQWWLISGEPDSNRNRTEKVSVITLK